MNPALPFEKVAIRGVGLLGGSIGLALRRAEFDGPIVGLGRRAVSLEAAIAAGTIDRGFLDVAPALEGADLVVLAGPVGTFADLMAAAAGHLSPAALVTDVGSTKAQVVRWANRLLPAPGRFVGAHPIAGSEKRGPQFARADLFDGACCVLTPTARTDPAALARATRLWEALGMRTVMMSPPTHDRVLARVSHLPHAVAAALMRLADRPLQDLAGPGFVDMTRLAGGDPELWRDIFLTNRPATQAAIARLIRELERFSRLLARGDGAVLRQYLADAQQQRQAMIGLKLRGDFFEG